MGPSPRGSLMGDDKPRATTGGPSLAATGELVADIRVEGNQTIAAHDITAQMATRVGRPFDPRALERDVQKLAEMPWFVNVRTLTQKTEGGRVVILRVVERPTIRYIEYLGNSKLSDKRLAKETGLKIGRALDPYLIEEGRRKIAQAYADNGYTNAQVSILAGTSSDDEGVEYVINEGVKQKIWAVKFEGNESGFASDRRLKTKIQSKPGVLMLFGGKLNRDELKADIQALTAYYRAFGFFQARVGRILEFDDSGKWATITFVIHEGPRYAVRDVRFVGNEKFATEALMQGVKMPAGEPFEQARMNQDVEFLKEVYGSQGYVFADVRAEPVFLEEPGKIDLVYHIEEGKAWRVGRIFVHINGENPHTRIQTALNRLSIRPGEVLDIRELRASERRLAASTLFSDPARGVSPKITYRIPELEDTNFTASGGGGGAGSFRGQSPEAQPWILEQVNGAGRRIYRAIVGGSDAPRAGDASPMDVHVVVGQQGDAAGDEAKAVDPQPTVYEVRKPITEATTQQAQRPVHVAYEGLDLPAPRVTRGQGPAPAPRRNYANPYPGGEYGGSAPRATSPETAPVRQTQYQQPPSRPQQAVSQPSTAWRSTPSSVAPAQFEQSPSNLPPPGGAPPGEAIFPAPPNQPTTPIEPDSQLFPPDQFANPRVDVHVNLEEVQTGRLMFGVGVNSDAGVVGQILIDERNFDWRNIPTSWQDWRNGAFRGGGQRFRIEAAPGTEVQRYLASFQEPYLWDTPISLSLSGSYFDRRYDDWDEQRLGGRIGLGYQWTANDLSGRLTYRGENVNVHDPRFNDPELNAVLGDNVLHGFGVVLANDTRNNPFLATEGHYLELTLEQVVGTWDYPRAELDARKYWLVRERPDHSGRHVISAQTRLGFTGSNTPIYDRFYAGGYSTMRGFDFRGASPRVGGDFRFLNTVEYMFPLTADDAFHGVVFCDFGTVEENVTIDTWRVSPGVGLRLQVPGMGPAPIALDFAWPVSRADGDDLRVFTFFVGLQR